MKSVVKIFKALSDSNRIRILKMLEIRSLCVCEITTVLNLASSTVSKHLSVLRNADLILDKKEGKWVNYSLNPSTSEQYVSQILPLLSQWLVDDTTILQDAVQVRKVNRLNLCGV